MEPVLKILSLQIGYKNRNKKSIKIAGPLNIEAHEGEFICLIGPNGSGKSTLMRTISKVQDKLGGDIRIMGKDINDIPRQDLARQLSLVLTDAIPHINLDVNTLISLGRYPYTGWFGTLTKKDHGIISWATECTGLEALAGRNLHELSDGELQKAMIARALAQDTKLMLLDEPTAHLDVANRIEIIRLLKDLASNTGKTIILTTHELDLALKAADKLWMLSAGHQFQSGVPEDLVLDGVIAKIFGSKGLEFDINTGSFKLHKGLEKTISISGDDASVYWTTRSMERTGYKVITDKRLEDHIEILKKDDHRFWNCTRQGNQDSFDSIASMLPFYKSRILNR